MNHSDVLDLAEDGKVSMLEQVIDDGRAWTRETVKPRDWTVTLPQAALKEIEEVLYSLRRDPLPTLMLSADQFELPACAEAMGKIRQLLSEGLGVAVLERMPMDAMSIEEARSVYWVLGQFVGMEVAQKWDGSMLYDVTDTGAHFQAPMTA